MISRRNEQGRNLVLRDHADPRLLAAHDALHRGDVQTAHNFIHALLFIEKEEELDQRIVAVIYGACDPRSKELKYVGKTRIDNGDIVRSLRRRKLAHLNHLDKSGRSAWMRSLSKQNVHPDFFVIETLTSIRSWQEAERFWIAYFKFVGCSLVNGNDGGGGERTTSNAKLTAMLAFRVPRIIRDALEYVARSRDISVGQLVRDELERYFRERGIDYGGP